MMFRLCAAGFKLLLVLVSWLAIGCWYWYGDVGLKLKHQCALHLQTINMGLDKDSRALLVKLFFTKTTVMLLLFASIDALKNTERSFFVPGLKNMIWRFELTGDLGIAPGRGRRPIAPEIVEELSVDMAENAGSYVRWPITCSVGLPRSNYQIAS